MCTLQEDPVITYLKTTSLPIEDVAFPAITICGQGLVKEVVANAINKQFSDYVSEKDTNMTLKNMTQEEKATKYELFLNETFSGLGKYFFYVFRIQIAFTVPLFPNEIPPTSFFS